MTQHMNTQKGQSSHIHSVLQSEPDNALKDLIKITQSLIDLADREAHVLAKNDIMEFAIMQDEKAVMTQRYIQMSRAFRERLEEFRGKDPGLLDQLENLQKDLSDITRANNNVIGQIQNRAKQNTSTTLFSAQELGQKCSLNRINESANSEISPQAAE